MLDNRSLVIGGSGFIGTHLVERLTKLSARVLSIDINPPNLIHHRKLWVRRNIMSAVCLQTVFTQFKPTHVFNLAAKANLNGKTIKDFPENTIGTENVIKCINECRSIKRFIHFSTQYVVKPGIWPEKEEFLLPYTPYGESKAAAEMIVRNKCSKCWVILRPTNVWGPFHSFFPYELWNYLRLRLYLHPGYRPIIKHYSFVTNAVDQVVGISLSNLESACGKVFYITDPPIDNADWMNAFSIALTGKQIRRIPFEIWRLLAKTGDVLNRSGLKCPMSSERLFRLTVNEQIPYATTTRLTGLPKVSLEEGVEESVRWYESVLAGAPIDQWIV